MVVFLLERKKEADPNRLQKGARERGQRLFMIVRLPVWGSDKHVEYIIDRVHDRPHFYKM